MEVYIKNHSRASGEWFSLPVNKQEVFSKIFSEKELDKKGDPLGEYAITDWKLPFHINGHESIETLNDVAQYVQETPEFEPIIANDYDLGDAIRLAEETGNDDLLVGIVSDEQIDQLLKDQIEEHGWTAGASFLANINYTNDDYYFYNKDMKQLESLRSDYPKTLVATILERYTQSKEIENAVSLQQIPLKENDGLKTFVNIVKNNHSDVYQSVVNMMGNVVQNAPTQDSMESELPSQSKKTESLEL